MRPRASLAALALAALATNAPAQETPAPRCALLAQVSTASLLRLATALSEGAEVAIDRHIARLADLSTTYDTLGCDAAALGQAFDCVLSNPDQANPRTIARQCLQENALIPQ